MLAEACGAARFPPITRGSYFIEPCFLLLPLLASSLLPTTPCPASSSTVGSTVSNELGGLFLVAGAKQYSVLAFIAYWGIVLFGYDTYGTLLATISIPQANWTL